MYTITIINLVTQQLSDEMNGNLQILLHRGGK